MSLRRTTMRRSRRHRRCDGCKGPIEPGERYAEHVAAPDPYGELGNTTWWRLAECSHCCARYGRPIMEPSTSCEDLCMERCIGACGVLP